MGFESFRVELRGGTITYREAGEIVRELPHVQPDHHSMPLPGSSLFVVHDGQYAIELELMDSPVRLSCRFTLCHPASVDAAFLELVRELVMRLGMEVRICDDVPPEYEHPFALVAFPEFSAIALRRIAARRAEWIAAFGARPMAATTSEVHERIILPRCQPRIEQPT